MSAPLQGSVSFEALRNDVDFMNADPVDQIGYLKNVFLPKIDPDFSKGSDDEKVSYIQDIVLPKINTGESILSNPKFTPLESLGNAVAGGATGVFKGLLPVENSPFGESFSFDPIGRAAETATRVPTALLANIGFSVPTGGLYNAAYSGINTLSRNQGAYSDAMRSQEYQRAQNINKASIPSTALSSLLGAVLGKLPGSFGDSLAKKTATGLGLGYSQDVLNNTVDQYAQTGNVKPVLEPGLSTLVGGVLPGAVRYTNKENLSKLKGFLKKKSLNLETESQTPSYTARISSEEVDPYRALNQVVSLGVKVRKASKSKLPNSEVQLARFENYIRKFSPEEQALIKGRISDVENQEKISINSQKSKKNIRKKLGLLKRDQNLENKRKSEIIRQEIEKDEILKEKRQQALELRIEKTSQEKILEELNFLRKSDDKASLNNRLSILRKRSKQDFTKQGLSQNESSSINSQYENLLNQYNKITLRDKKVDKLKAEISKAKERTANRDNKAEYDKNKKELQNLKEDILQRSFEKNKKSVIPREQPRVLDADEIEEEASALLSSLEKREKGSLDARLKFIKKASSYDYTKDGATPERSKLINRTYQRVLDRFNQKKTTGSKEPGVLKVGQEKNRIELEKLNDQGGRYKPGDSTALQRPSKLLKLDEVKKDEKWARISASDRTKVEKFLEAAENDGEVILKYRAEKSGDTGQFQLKTVSPLGVKYQGDAIVGYGINRDGHTAMYYISESLPNPKTGKVSFTKEITVLKESYGKAKKGLDANTYIGPQEVQVDEILSRPIRTTIGYTSDIEKLSDSLSGQKASEIIETFNKKVQKANKIKKGIAKEIARDAMRLKDEEVLKALEENPQARKNLHEDSTGDPC